jgi:hypothetical protein
MTEARDVSLLDYSEESRAYRLYNPIAKKYVINCFRDVQFKKNEAYFESKLKVLSPFIFCFLLSL